MAQGCAPKNQSPDWFFCTWMYLSLVARAKNVPYIFWHFLRPWRSDG